MCVCPSRTPPRSSSEASHLTRLFSFGLKCAFSLFFIFIFKKNALEESLTTPIQFHFLTRFLKMKHNFAKSGTKIFTWCTTPTTERVCLDLLWSSRSKTALFFEIKGLILATQIKNPSQKTSCVARWPFWEIYPEFFNNRYLEQLFCWSDFDPCLTIIKKN